MTATAVETVLRLSIDVESDCRKTPDCEPFVLSEYSDTFYSNPGHPLSIAPLPATGDLYEYRTCSKVVRENARVSARRGFRYERIDRADWEDDLHAIRSSARERQGRTMPQAYLERQAYSHDVPSGCPRHSATVHGVIGLDGHLVAYCQLMQCGEVVRFNTILGHADSLADRVVWLLVLEAIKWHIGECGARFALYYTHDSGHGPGLRYFKERFGFSAAEVEWVIV